MKSYYLSARCLCLASISTLGSCTTESPVSNEKERIQLNLSATEHPVKMVTDTITGDTYWLDFVGNIYCMPHNSEQREPVVRATGPERTALFIADFFLDVPQRCIYFTDLRDSETGRSAIKRIDLKEKQIETLDTFTQEVPYRVGISPIDGQLYYFTRGLRVPHQLYQLKVLGQPMPLITSSNKLTDIERWMSNYLEPVSAQQRTR